MAGTLSSCSSTKRLQIQGVSYQSIRTSFARPDQVPKDARIAVEYFFDDNGRVQPVVCNLTDEILTIDQSKSFLVNTDGVSTSYYDPNVYTTTSGAFESSTQGSSFNLGAVTSALGVGGVLGHLANGTTLHSSNTSGSYSSNSVAIYDQKQITVGPRGMVALGKQFKVKNLGWSGINYRNSFTDLSRSKSPLKFSITISFSFEESGAQEKLTTDFYVNSSINIPATNNVTSTAFNTIYKKKPDALAEYLYMFLVQDNVAEVEEDVDPWYGIRFSNQVNKAYMQGFLIDYK